MVKQKMSPFYLKMKFNDEIYYRRLFNKVLKADNNFLLLCLASIILFVIINLFLEKDFISIFSWGIVFAELLYLLSKISFWKFWGKEIKKRYNVSKKIESEGGEEE